MTNSQPAGEIVLYQRGDTPAIDVRLDGDTVWLSLNQIATLLGRDKSTISRHISNVFAEGELVRDSVVAEFATTAIMPPKKLVILNEHGRNSIKKPPRITGRFFYA